MDINSRNILAATAGGVPGPPALIDPGRYFVVPYNTNFSESANQLLFVTNEDPTYTAKVVYRVTVDFVNATMYTMRFGGFVVQIAASSPVGAGSVRGITNNTIYDNFNIFTLSGQAVYGTVDVLKRSSTQFIVAYGRSGFTFSILVFNVNLVTGVVSFVANHDIASIVSLGGQYYDSPRIGGGGNFDGNGLLSQAITTFGYSTFYSYSGPYTETRYGVFTLNAAGTSASSASSIINNNNFSRPRCGTGDQGHYIISNMDGSSYYSSASTSVQNPSIGSSTFSTASPHQPFVGVLGTNTFASYGPNTNNPPYPPALSRNANPSSQFSSVISFPSNTAVNNRSAALQSFKGGFMFTYTDADNVNRMTRYRYNSGSVTQQYVYDENGSIIVGGSVNGNATVRYFQNW